MAELYRQRWTSEGRFYEVTQTLNCEPNTLGYPKAALFAFCLALVASNAVALLKAALRSVHDDQRVAEMSSYYLALEVQETYRGMMIALPPSAWECFRHLPVAVLRQVARRVRPANYAKTKRGPRKLLPAKGTFTMGAVSRRTNSSTSGGGSNDNTLEALALRGKDNTFWCSRYLALPGNESKSEG